MRVTTDTALRIAYARRNIQLQLWRRAQKEGFAELWWDETGGSGERHYTLMSGAGELAVIVETLRKKRYSWRHRWLGSYMPAARNPPRKARRCRGLLPPYRTP